jgi:hypothetical protein
MPEDLNAEVRFAKTQQWLVATAAGTLLGGIFAVARTMRPLVCWEQAFATVLLVLIVVSASYILVSLQNHLPAKRRQINSGDTTAWLRGTDVLPVLIGAIVVGALIVGYSVWRA